MLKEFDKIVIKKGFLRRKTSKGYNKELVADYGDFASITRRLNLKNLGN